HGPDGTQKSQRSMRAAELDERAMRSGTLSAPIARTEITYRPLGRRTVRFSDQLVQPFRLIPRLSRASRYTRLAHGRNLFARRPRGPRNRHFPFVTSARLTSTRRARARTRLPFRQRPPTAWPEMWRRLCLRLRSRLLITEDGCAPLQVLW